MRPNKKRFARRRNSATSHPDKSPSYHPKGGTSTEVRSPTSTSTEVRSPTETSTSTSTDAYTAGNVTVTGGAGAGATTVRIHQQKVPESAKGSQRSQRAPWAGVPKVHGVKNPGFNAMLAALPHSVAGKKASAALQRFFGGRSKNPLAESEAMFEMFHGMAPTEILEIVDRVHVHSKLWALGTLTSMKVQTETGRTFDLNAPDPDRAKASDVVYVASNEKGNQIYFRGGDQEIPQSLLKSRLGFNSDDFRDQMIIGWVTELTYRTKKSFEKNGEELVDFFHTLGKEHSRGAVPMLVYKPRDPSMALFGGRYKVLPKRGDIGASPGIAG